MRGKNLTNQKFNCLTAIRLDNKRYELELEKYNKGLIKNKPCNHYWVCKCECGNYVNIRANNLKENSVYSCGCKVSPNIIKFVRERSKKYNHYDLTKETGIGYAHNNNEKFYFDKEDFEKIKDLCWMDRKDRIISSIPNDSLLYQKSTRKSKVKHIALHHLILGIYDANNIIVDHIDRNPRNNCKSNLRLVTPSENMYNRSLSKNNSSGITGVHFNNKDKRWRSEIVCKKQYRYLGQFINKEDAIKCRLKAELKYFGKDFSPQRHLFEKYNIKEEN